MIDRRSDVLERDNSGPLFSNADKRTSAEAAAVLKASPEHLSRMRQEALDLVREFPGRTCKALAQIARSRRGSEDQGLEWYRQRIGRRLSELERGGKIRSGDAVLEANGRRAVTWWPS